MDSMRIPAVKFTAPPLLCSSNSKRAPISWPLQQKHLMVLDTCDTDSSKGQCFTHAAFTRRLATQVTRRVQGRSCFHQGLFAQVKGRGRSPNACQYHADVFLIATLSSTSNRPQDDTGHYLFAYTAWLDQLSNTGLTVQVRRPSSSPHGNSWSMSPRATCALRGFLQFGFQFRSPDLPRKVPKSDSLYAFRSIP